MNWELFLSISTGTLFIICVILGFIIRNLLIKHEKAEDIVAGYMGYLSKLDSIIKTSDKTLKVLDHKGSFKSDDEVGFFFKAIQDMQDILNEFKIKKI